MSLPTDANPTYIQCTWCGGLRSEIIPSLFFVGGDVKVVSGLHSKHDDALFCIHLQLMNLSSRAPGTAVKNPATAPYSRRRAHYLYIYRYKYRRAYRYSATASRFLSSSAAFLVASSVSLDSFCSKACSFCSRANRLHSSRSSRCFSSNLSSSRCLFLRDLRLLMLLSYFVPGMKLRWQAFRCIWICCCC